MNWELVMLALVVCFFNLVFFVVGVMAGAYFETTGWKSVFEKKDGQDE